ncbi:DAK2 domain-containing protein [Mycoplasmoides pirum]|uniref:DAK2 domain-containing protein n=1 Tax=Mycoplasmoides pirum TaxID=2122 RepID=UPI00047F6A3F|nr:DAK2 domain-containing protein [Mycoplasmoides pirum]
MQIQKNHLNHKLKQYILNLILVIAENQNKINKLSSYFERGDLGTRFNDCFQKIKQLLISQENLDYVVLSDISNLIKKTIGSSIGDVLSFWVSNFLRYLHYFYFDSIQNAISESLYNATIETGRKFKLFAGDKSFYSVLLPCIKVIYNNSNISMDELKLKLNETIEKNLLQNIYSRSHFGKARYLGKRSINVLDPGAYIIYLAFQAFINSKEIYNETIK